MKLLIAAIFFSLPALAASEDFPASVSERGFFSVSIPLSYLETRVLNADGSFASYKGGNAGLGIDIQLWGGSEGNSLRLFGTYLVGEATGEPSDNKLKRDETFFGLKAYPASWVFVGAGMGRMTSKVSSSSVGDLSLSSTTSGIGAGLETHLGGSWFGSFSGWYKSGAIKQKDNTGITYNSFSEGAEVQLQLIWSPPSTTFNFTSKSGR